MLVSEKVALYQFLQTVGTSANSSGFAAFFRNGSSASIPRTLMDLIASSRCAVEYKFQSQGTEANGLLTRQFSRGRSMLPIGGYGQKRTQFIAGASVDTFAVYPEYSRLTPAIGTNNTPQQVCAQLSAAFDFTNPVAPSWAVGDVVEYDYGRSLHIRGMMINVAQIASTSWFDVSYLNSSNVWTSITGLAQGMNDGLDITARRIRITCKTATTAYQSFTLYAERSSEYVSAALTHVVLVPLLLAMPSGANNYLGNVADDYYGLVLDVPTDMTLGVPNIGKFTQQAVPDLSFRIADNFLESV